jgi:glyoxylase-like metal-dependent hydrolase (beta-lactamase superfamily II)
VTDVAPADLYRRLSGEKPPRILDVRNAEEFGRWKVEGTRSAEALNIPYFDFIEAEEQSVDAVRRWIDGYPDGFVVVCAKGDSSAFVADVLRSRGLAPENLRGGMMEWGRAAIFEPLEMRGLRAWQVQRFGKGCLSYVLAVGNAAVVVDPHRDAGEYRRFLRDNGLALHAVFDTHLHADHVSGAPELAAAERVPYHGHPADFSGANFPFEPVADGARLRVAGIDVSPLAFLPTPGHTPGSVSLLVNDELLLTGDTLFVGSAGRPDLGGREREWGRDLFRSLHSRLGSLAGTIRVLPAHTAGPSEIGARGTVEAALGDLRRENPALQLDEAAFLEQIVSTISPAPPHYARIRQVNLGLAKPSVEETDEMELGRNECAMSRR